MNRINYQRLMNDDQWTSETNVDVSDQGSTEDSSPAQQNTDSDFQNNLSLLPAPSHEERISTPWDIHKGLITSSRTHPNNPSTEKNPQGNRKHKLPFPSNQTGKWNKTSAPNLGGCKGKEVEAMNGRREESTYYTNPEKRMKSPINQVRTSEDSTATRDRTTGTPVNQPTLCRVLGANLSQSEEDKGNSRILGHGPRSQGPRTLLVVGQNDYKSSWRRAVSQILKKIKLRLLFLF